MRLNLPVNQKRLRLRFIPILGTAVTACVVISLLVYRAWFIQSFDDIPINEGDWPPSLQSFVNEARLTPTQSRNIVVMQHLGGWSCKVPATSKLVEFIQQTLVPIADIEPISGVERVYVPGRERPTEPEWAFSHFMSHIPQQWHLIVQSSDTRFFANKDWNPGVEGRDNFVASYNPDQNVVVVCYYFNF